MNIKELEKKAAQVRVDALCATNKAGSGFMASCMSVVEMLVTLYYADFSGRPVMNFDVEKPGSEDQDYVILSKGHAAAAWYAVLADLGFFDKGELEFLRQINSLLQGRPRMKVPGVPVSTISPGIGLSAGVGLAAAIKMDRKKNRVFTILGDAELQSGEVWEAVMSAAHYKLNNLVLLIDHNKLQEGGHMRKIMDVTPIQGKFDAFGWQVIQVRDGHDFDQLLDALYRGFKSISKPVCIWCHTIKGKGVEFAEGKEEYHGVALSDQELMDVISKLEASWKDSP